MDSGELEEIEGERSLNGEISWKFELRSSAFLAPATGRLKEKSQVPVAPATSSPSTVFHFLLKKMQLFTILP